VIFTAAGYSKRPKVHDIRKFLGKKIKGGLIKYCDLVKDSLIVAIGKHGSVLVSQIYGHEGAGTYPKDYLLHYISIDIVLAVLDEEDQSQHVKCF
jgi:hypothetical protein